MWSHLLDPLWRPSKVRFPSTNSNCPPLIGKERLEFAKQFLSGSAMNGHKRQQQSDKATKNDTKYSKKGNRQANVGCLRVCAQSKWRVPSVVLCEDIAALADGNRFAERTGHEGMRSLRSLFWNELSHVISANFHVQTCAMRHLAHLSRETLQKSMDGWDLAAHSRFPPAAAWCSGVLPIASCRGNSSNSECSSDQFEHPQKSAWYLLRVVDSDRKRVPVLSRSWCDRFWGGAISSQRTCNPDATKHIKFPDCWILLASLKVKFCAGCLTLALGHECLRGPSETGCLAMQQLRTKKKSWLWSQSASSEVPVAAFKDHAARPLKVVLVLKTMVDETGQLKSIERKPFRDSCNRNSQNWKLKSNRHHDRITQVPCTPSRLDAAWVQLGFRFIFQHVPRQSTCLILFKYVCNTFLRYWPLMQAKIPLCAAKLPAVVGSRLPAWVFEAACASRTSWHDFKHTCTYWHVQIMQIRH